MTPLTERRQRAYAGTFIIILMVVMSGYGLSMAALREVAEQHRPSSLVQTAVLIPAACAPIVWMTARSGYPARSFGITLSAWPRVLWQSTLYSLPVLGLLFALKWTWVRADPLLAGESILRHDALAIIGYVALCPLQEFFARSALQGSLEKLVAPGGARRTWTVIVVSNLFFATAHTHLGFGYAALAFIPGLFWGWLYDKQRSLLGVTFSHALIGCAAIFVLGLDRMLPGSTP